MSYEEKDWILRQIKQIAKGLGQMLSKESIKEIVNLELSESEKLTDSELEDILLILEANEKKDRVAKEFNIDSERFQLLIKDYTLMTVEERAYLKNYVSK